MLASRRWMPFLGLVVGFAISACEGNGGHPPDNGNEGGTGGETPLHEAMMPVAQNSLEDDAGNQIYGPGHHVIESKRIWAVCKIRTYAFGQQNIKGLVGTQPFGTSAKLGERFYDQPSSWELVAPYKTKSGPALGADLFYTKLVLGATDLDKAGVTHDPNNSKNHVNTAAIERDFQGLMLYTVAHEIGHMLNLQHEDIESVPGNLMRAASDAGDVLVQSQCDRARPRGFARNYID